ncbi:MAG: GspH/FimT family pseudopilin, partial [Thiobacillus sp.]|nr:GspH/FimT family pseudopilin [Thiobacillus sp.]
ASADNKGMLSQGRLQPRIQAAHSSNETAGRCKVEFAASLSIESTMEKKLPLRGIQKGRLSGWQSAFTLIELLVTVAIAAIVLTIAVPNFITFVQNSRLTGQANDLVTALNFARSEAIKRGVRVSVCSRSTDTTCAAATVWNTGWLVFVDTNGNGAVDGEAVLLVRQPLESVNTLNSSSLQRVTYQNTGFSGIAGTLRLCDARSTANARAIVVSAQGRVRTGPLSAEPGGLTCP